MNPKILAALQGSVPMNQNMTPGGYMQQAMQLSGVPKYQAPAPVGIGTVPGQPGPGQMLQGFQGLSPQILQYLQALMGGFRP